MYLWTYGFVILIVPTHLTLCISFSKLSIPLRNTYIGMHFYLDKLMNNRHDHNNKFLGEVLINDFLYLFIHSQIFINI